MNHTVENKVPVPKNMAQLLPGIKAILSKESIQALTLLRKPCADGNLQTRTTEKVRRPLTIAEIRALTGPPQKKFQPPSSKVKPWNSSVKVEKTKSVTATADGQVKCSTVRKVLNFQPKPVKRPAAAANTWKTMTNSIAKKSLPSQGKTKALPKISGVSRMVETPVLKKPLAKKKANISLKSNSDDSFLLKEKEINEFQAQYSFISKASLEKIVEISPPVSTPFKEYVSVEDHFDLNSSPVENSITFNDNIKMYNKEFDFKENNREESVMVSLCEGENFNNNYIKNFDLLELEKQNERDIKEIDNVIDKLKSMRETRMQFLQFIRYLKHEEARKHQVNGNSTNLIPPKSEPFKRKDEEKLYVGSPIKANLPSYKIPRRSISLREIVLVKKKDLGNENRTNIIPPKSEPLKRKDKEKLSHAGSSRKSSPSYKISRKSICRTKKGLFKSMPNISDGIHTPKKRTSLAATEYMNLKHGISFLQTPMGKRWNAGIPDTPTITSHNLQKQLDKLYD